MSYVVVAVGVSESGQIDLVLKFVVVTEHTRDEVFNQHLQLLSIVSRRLDGMEVSHEHLYSNNGRWR